jgi:hypothetical protein
VLELLFHPFYLVVSKNALFYGLGKYCKKSEGIKLIKDSKDSG